uniref:HAT C-terminal dimerisation domain-containing protein n=1 Tax=Lactuca sativa TaxID=4236 RepID=A0A9R1XHS2_LACSA|nr:hypothetical protein LSAT_V11C400183290 [Lactuca sativa]
MRPLFSLYNSSMSKKEKDKEVLSSTSNVSPSSMWGHEVVMDIKEIMTKRFEMEMGSSQTILKKAYLDKYLSEDHEHMDVNFDILTWSKMARDMLAIPISTVASKSAFSTGGRVLYAFRTCLTSKMVETLVCTQYWVRESHEPINIDDILLEVEKMEEEDLTMEKPTIIIDETVDELTERLGMN